MNASPEACPIQSRVEPVEAVLVVSQASAYTMEFSSRIRASESTASVGVPDEHKPTLPNNTCPSADPIAILHSLSSTLSRKMAIEVNLEPLVVCPT